MWSPILLRFVICILWYRLIRTPLLKIWQMIFVCQSIKSQQKMLIWIMWNKPHWTHNWHHLILVLGFFKRWGGKERVLGRMSKVCYYWKAPNRAIFYSESLTVKSFILLRNYHLFKFLAMLKSNHTLILLFLSLLRMLISLNFWLLPSIATITAWWLVFIFTKSSLPLSLGIGVFSFLWSVWLIKFVQSLSFFPLLVGFMCVKYSWQEMNVDNQN